MAIISHWLCLQIIICVWYRTRTDVVKQIEACNSFYLHAIKNTSGLRMHASPIDAGCFSMQPWKDWVADTAVLPTRLVQSLEPDKDFRANGRKVYMRQSLYFVSGGVCCAQRITTNLCTALRVRQTCLAWGTRFLTKLRTDTLTPLGSSISANASWEGRLIELSSSGIESTSHLLSFINAR